uniref:OSJNBa0065J03.14 protein n=1 Tax=Oryza sativa subsp. japonica TaxID=39947 RepID=Q7XVV8_ORYSJ|nr:OSJNBa0065J03.14 [Oryza sativa Japonica Group]
MARGGGVHDHRRRPVAADGAKAAAHSWSNGAAKSDGARGKGKERKGEGVLTREGGGDRRRKTREAAKSGDAEGLLLLLHRYFLGTIYKFNLGLGGELQGVTYGHLNFDALRSLASRGMVRGIPTLERVTKMHDEGQEHAGGVLGRGGHHCRLHPQPGADKERPRQDTVRVMARSNTCCALLSHIWLRRLRQGGETTHQELDDRSKVMVFLGYEPGSKAYRIYDPVAKRIVVSRDAVFDEAASWPWASPGEEDGGTSPQETFTVRYEVVAVDVPSRHSDSMSSPAHMGTPVPSISASPGVLAVEFVSLPAETPDVDDDSTGPRRFWMVAKILDTTSPIELDSDELHRPIGLKWVFKLKKDETGAIVKHKARLVAKGYVQRQGIDFDEVFAPVARMESVRLLLAIAAHLGSSVHHMNVKSAFLNGELEEEVYVAQPLGFIDDKHPHQVLRLNRALYGLRQAPRAWNAKLDVSLHELGFTRGITEHAVYTRGTGNARLIIGIYVDDLIITGAHSKTIQSFKEEMHSLFRMSDLGLLSYYLGIEVHQGNDGITINQSTYAQKLLKMGGLAASASVPMEPRLKLTKNSDRPSVDSTFYRGLVGSLRYLVHSRPDIAFAVGYVSRFMESPRNDHLTAVKHILRYVAGEEGIHLLGFSDSDLGGDAHDRKSTCGALFFLGSSPIVWQSQKQKVVALSSSKAEYIAATGAACLGIWLARLLAEVLGSDPGKALLKVDNKSAISLCKNPVFHDRSKHIDTREKLMEQKKKKKKKKKKGSVRRLEETLLLNFMQQEKRSFIADQTETTSPCPCRGEDGGMGWPGTRDRQIKKYEKWDVTRQLPLRMGMVKFGPFNH